MSSHPRRRAGRSLRGLGGSSDRAGGSYGLPDGCNGESGPNAPLDKTPRLSHRPGDSGGESDKLAQNMVFDRLSPALKAPHQAALRQVLDDLSGPAEPGELAVEAAVLARFRSRVHPAAARAAVARTSPWRRFMPHSPRLAAGLAAVAIVAGGSAAAYAGALPVPLQNFAHRVIDAPAARHPSGQQPGGGRHHRPGGTPAGAAFPRQAPHSTPPGSAHARTQPVSSAHPSRSAHPAQPRPSANPGPRPGRSSHPVPPQASQPARESHPAQSGRPSRASRRPQPSHGLQQSPPARASQPRAGMPATAPSQAAGPGSPARHRDASSR